MEGGVGAADEFGAAAAAADVAVAVGGALAVAFAPAVVAAAGNAEAEAVADGEGDAGVPAGLAAAPGFVALFAGGFEQEVVFGGEIGTALTGDVGTGDADIGLFAGAGGGEAHLALGLDAGGGGLVAVYMVVLAVVLLAVGDGDVDRPAFAAAFAVAAAAGIAGGFGGGGVADAVGGHLVGLIALVGAVGGGHDVDAVVAALADLFGGSGSGLGGLHQVGHHGADGDGEAFLGVAVVVVGTVGAVGGLDGDVLGADVDVAVGKQAAAGLGVTAASLNQGVAAAAADNAAALDDLAAFLAAAVGFVADKAAEGAVAGHEPGKAAAAAVVFVQRFTGGEDVDVVAGSQLQPFAAEYLGADDVDVALCGIDADGTAGIGAAANGAQVALGVLTVALLPGEAGAGGGHPLFESGGGMVGFPGAQFVGDIALLLPGFAEGLAVFLQLAQFGGFQIEVEAKAAAAALVLGAGVFLYVGGTEVDFFGLQRQIAPGKELGGLGVDAFAGGNHGVAVQTADPAGDGGGEVVVLGGAAAGLAVADIGYAVAHAESQAGTAGAVGVFVAVVVLGGIELDFTAGGQGGACVADDVVAAY